MTGVLFLPRHVFRHRKINRFTASFETRKRNRTIVRVFIKFRVIGCAGPYARAQLAPLSKTGSLLRPPSETPRSSLGKCTLKSRCPGRRFVANGMEGTIRRRRREPTTDGRTTTAAGEFDCERRNGFSYDRVGPPFSRRLFSSLPFFFVSPVYGRRQFSTERYRHVRKSTHCLRHAARTEGRFRAECTPVDENYDIIIIERIVSKITRRQAEGGGWYTTRLSMPTHGVWTRAPAIVFFFLHVEVLFSALISSSPPSRARRYYLN